MTFLGAVKLELEKLKKEYSWHEWVFDEKHYSIRCDKCHVSAITPQWSCTPVRGSKKAEGQND